MLPKRGNKKLFSLADKVKSLRMQKGMTQTELAKQLGLTRSSVNGWEMGLSVPSTQFIAELANIFGVGAGYLLGIESEKTISVEGLNDKEISSIMNIIDCLKDKNNSEK